MRRSSLLAPALLAVMILASPSVAQPTCSFAAGVVTATLTGGSARIYVDGNEAIVLDAGGDLLSCAGANNTNTASIVVTGSSGRDTLTIGVRGLPPFDPAIAFQVDLGGSRRDQLDLPGSTGDDRIAFGRSGGAEVVDMDGDGAVDVTLANVELGSASDGLGGDDVMTGSPGGGIRPTRLDLELSSANGRDRLTGGNGDDLLTSQGGRDRLRGGRGNDRLSGGAAPDRLDGGPGIDVCHGAGGRDRLRRCERGDD